MKKIILGAALLVTVGNTYAMYPGAVLIKWQAKGEGVYWVSFIYNGVKMSAKYNYLGVYLGG
jgi:hypothetical protein